MRDILGQTRTRVWTKTRNGGNIYTAPRYKTDDATPAPRPATSLSLQQQAIGTYRVNTLWQAGVHHARNVLLTILHMLVVVTQRHQNRNSIATGAYAALKTTHTRFSKFPSTLQVLSYTYSINPTQKRHALCKPRLNI